MVGDARFHRRRHFNFSATGKQTGILNFNVAAWAPLLPLSPFAPPPKIPATTFNFASVPECSSALTVISKFNGLNPADASVYRFVRRFHGGWHDAISTHIRLRIPDVSNYIGQCLFDKQT